MSMSASMNAARRVAAHNEVTRQQEAAQDCARMVGGPVHEDERLLIDADRRRAGPNIWSGCEYDDEHVGLGAAAFVVVSAAVMVVALALIGWGWLSTGPDCPGKDPAWLGWCSEAPQVTR